MQDVRERRLFLKYLGAGFAGVLANAAGPLGPIAEARGAMPFHVGPALLSLTGEAALDFLTFDPIASTDRDDLVN
jgi:hypothetical protein